MWGDDVRIKIKIFEKKCLFVLLDLVFLCYYCAINLKRQSEYSVLRPDPSTLVFRFIIKYFDFQCLQFVLVASFFPINS